MPKWTYGRSEDVAETERIEAAKRAGTQLDPAGVAAIPPAAVEPPAPPPPPGGGLAQHSRELMEELGMLPGEVLTVATVRRGLDLAFERGRRAGRQEAAQAILAAAEIAAQPSGVPHDPMVLAYVRGARWAARIAEGEPDGT